jgi:hypothetical protein
LGHARGEKSQIGEAAPIERKILDRARVEQRRNRAGLGVDERGRARDGQVLLRPGDGEAEIELGRAADIHVQLRCLLR